MFDRGCMRGCKCPSQLLWTFSRTFPARPPSKLSGKWPSEPVWEDSRKISTTKKAEPQTKDMILERGRDSGAFGDEVWLSCRCAVKTNLCFLQQNMYIMSRLLRAPPIHTLSCEWSRHFPGAVNTSDNLLLCSSLVKDKGVHVWKQL